MFERLEAKPSPGHVGRQHDGERAYSQEVEVLEPEVLEALDQIAARQQAERIAAPSRRRWTAVAAAAVLVAGAGALAAVSWAVWGSDLRDGGEGAAPMLEEVSLVTGPSPNVKRLAGPNTKLVLLVEPDGRATLSVRGLNSPPRGKRYAAWVIRPGKPPWPAGLFDGGPGEQLVRLERRVPKGATVAVTLERAGGVDTPTTTKHLFSAKRL